MAATTKFGEIETVVRRDLVSDNDPTQYRWSSFQIMAAAVRAVADVVKTNEWAAYDQQTCRRIYGTGMHDVTRYCELNPKALAETTSFVVEGVSKTAEQYLAWLRDLTVPIDDRWHDAVAYFTAYHVLETAGGDAELRRRAVDFITIARENASR